VLEGSAGLRLRVRWLGGNETIFTPSGGSARVIGATSR
jgi:hypothetical protein